MGRTGKACKRNTVRENSLNEATKILSDGMAPCHFGKKNHPFFRPERAHFFYERHGADDFLSSRFNPGRHSFVVLPQATRILPLRGKEQIGY
ncbi:hypothetical protein [Gaoshiqia sp. Z1-71]|uniref:hypothetical protein n=1 Tax=Gaoshiqia hydrogeniformans TaxID=3290090 RepID=UPI003BF7C38C